eukprot:3052268-Amphidinium_carterae.1
MAIGAFKLTWLGLESRPLVAGHAMALELRLVTQSYLRQRLFGASCAHMTWRLDTVRDIRRALSFGGEATPSLQAECTSSRAMPLMLRVSPSPSLMMSEACLAHPRAALWTR